jgi:hypothetical protein
MTADPRATAWYRPLRPLHPYPTAFCPDCSRTRRIVKAYSLGSQSHYMVDRQMRHHELPANTRRVEVWFPCGHHTVIVTSRLEELGLYIDKRGCAQPWTRG